MTEMIMYVILLKKRLISVNSKAISFGNCIMFSSNIGHTESEVRCVPLNVAMVSMYLGGSETFSSVVLLT
ncbi:hypothetical protein ACQP3F_33410, partial [Escherichia coli]